MRKTRVRTSQSAGRVRGEIVEGGGGPLAGIRRALGLRRFCGFDGLRFVARRGGLRGAIVGRGTRALDFYAGDALAVHLDYGEAIVAVLEAFSAAGDEAELIENEAADGGVGGIFREADVVLGVEVADVEGGVENDGAVGESEGALDDVEFVVNFADDLLEDVFEGHEAEDAAEFVDDDGQADVMGAQLEE